MKHGRWTGAVAAAITATSLIASPPAQAAGPADTTGPVISDIGIAAGTEVNGTVTLRPTVSDDVAVTRVDLRVNTSLVTISRVAPFALTWNSRGHSDIDVRLQIVAYDAAGNTTISPVVIVHTDNRAPFIYFPWVVTGAPAQTPGLSFTGIVPLDFTKHGVAPDTAGIEVSAGSQVLGTLTAAPWSLDWDTSRYSGETTLSARAWDGYGNTHTATSTVWADHTGPTITTMLHRSADHVRAGGDVWVDTRDGAGIKQVELLVNGVVADTNRSGEPTVMLVWPKDAKNGPATMTIRARDDLGNVSEQTRTVTVDNTAPQVTVSPTTPLLRGTVNTALTSVRDVAGIDFLTVYLGHLQISDATSPWRIALDTRTVNDGRYTLTWSVQDKVANTTVIRRTVTVDTKPAVRLTAAPKNKSVLRKPAKISVSAKDTNGIHRAELLVNGKVVQTDRKAGYSFTLNPKRYGKKFTVQVRVYDKAGNVKYTAKRTYRR